MRYIQAIGLLKMSRFLEGHGLGSRGCLYKNPLHRANRSLLLCLDSWVSGGEVTWLLGSEVAESVALAELLRAPGLSRSKGSRGQYWLLAATSWARAEMMPPLSRNGDQICQHRPSALCSVTFQGATWHLPVLWWWRAWLEQGTIHSSGYFLGTLDLWTLEFQKPPVSCTCLAGQSPVFLLHRCDIQNLILEWWPWKQ